MKIVRREAGLAYALAAARTGLCAYRAAHQSITIDEAHTFNFYIAGPWSNFYARYIPHNHVLYSLLARGSVAAFGTSELAFRLPSVIAGFFLVLGIFRVLGFLESRTLRWIALIALSLHPLLLDFSIAARGYGLGLALLVWAIDFSMRGRYGVAGVLLGLAISAQLSMAVPALAAILSVALLKMSEDRLLTRAAPIRRRESVSKAPFRAVLIMALATAAVAALICAAPLHNADPRSFNLGYPTLRESIYSVVFPSTTDRAGLFIAAHSPGVLAEIVVVLLIAAFVAMGALRRLLFFPAPQLLPALMFVVSSAALVAAHLTAKLNYPVDRTGLYLILLFGLSWAMAAGTVRRRLYRDLNALLACLFIVQFAAQFDARSFRVWKFDMDTRHVAELLQRQCLGKPAASVAVSAVWINQQALEYYRRTLPIPALQPVEYHDPPPLAGYAFYVLNAGDRPQLDRFRVLYTGAESGIILAAPR